MTQRTPIAAAFLLTLAAATTHAQSTLPATAPTTQPAATVGVITGTTAGQLSKPNHGHRADVIFGDGKLQVRANNSSLNVILRQIASVTGMRITGGVNDDRVFGNYGPADPGTVIATLLSGTGVNVFVRMDETDSPAQLILTPRTGGVTPPDPNSQQYDEEARAESLADQPVPQPADQPATTANKSYPDVAPAQQPSVQPAGFTASPVANPVVDNSYNPNNSKSASSTPVPDPNASPVSSPPQIAQPLNNVNGDSNNHTPSASEIPTVQSVGTDALPQPSTTPSSSGIVDTPNQGSPAAAIATPAAATGTTTVTSPNGVATPDDIYQKLLKLQQAQQKAASGSSTTTTTTPPPQ